MRLLYLRGALLEHLLAVYNINTLLQTLKAVAYILTVEVINLACHYGLAVVDSIDACELATEVELSCWGTVC